jgi:hypothetical protein
MGARDRSTRDLPWLARQIPGAAALWSSWQRLSRPEPATRKQPQRRKRGPVRPVARRPDVACDPGLLVGGAATPAVVCAWCGTSLWAPAHSVAAGPVSHGLCAGCARRLTQH